MKDIIDDELQLVNKTSFLTLLCIENDILRNIDWSDKIQKCLSVKIRKKNFK